MDWVWRTHYSKENWVPEVLGGGEMGSVDVYALGCSTTEEGGREWIRDLHDRRVLKGRGSC